MLILTKLIDSTAPLPRSVTLLNQLRLDPDRSLGDVIRIVETDPVLSAKILALVNTPFYGVRRKITSISAACVQLGEVTIYSTALIAGIHSSFKFNLEPYGLNEKEFMLNTLMQMNLMNEWIRLAKPAFADELRLAAFLSDIGKIIISQLLIQEKKVEQFKQKLQNNIIESIAEKDTIGATTLQVSALMLQHWGVNEDITKLLQYTNASNRVPDNMKIPVSMMETTRNIWHSWNKKSEEIRQEAIEGYLVFDTDTFYMYEQSLNRVLDKLENIRVS
ncbi:MAG: HDOD domain-containing protein [Campylobacterota bacterium]|nr:HDOD domain-containing protein [Campylobacterota bacterium]